MTTIFSDVPYDLIRYIGNYLDYDSTINFNRVLHPTERLVHRKFTKQECFEHELVAQRQALLIAATIPNSDSSISTTRRVRKNCKRIIGMLKMLRIHKRGSIVWKEYPQFYDAVSLKCHKILDPESGFIDIAPIYYKKWLTKTAIALKMDLENNMPQRGPKRLVAQIQIKD